MANTAEQATPNMSVPLKASTPRFQLRLVWSRMVGVARLDPDVLSLLRGDRRFTGQAVGVLVLAALSYGVGYTLFSGFTSGNLSIYDGIVGTFATMISSCFSAFLWSITTFLVGTKLFHGRTSYWELARPLFFATTPGILLILNAIPIPSVPRNGMPPFPWFQALVTTVSIVWLLIAQTFALKQSMGFDTQRTLLTVSVGFLILVFLGLTFTPR